MENTSHAHTHVVDVEKSLESWQKCMKKTVKCAKNCLQIKPT